MSTLARWTAAAGGVVAVAATAAPAHASFLQELGSPFPVGTAPYGVVAADFSRDGFPDLVALNGTTSSITTILRRPTGSFQVEGPTGVVGGPSGGAVADFNRDGNPDVAVSGYDAPGAVSVHLRVPGGFMSANNSPYPVAKAGAVAVGNFNGDEYMDIVASRYDAGGLTVLLQEANGRFVAEGNAPSTGAGPRALAVGDFNRDGRPDVAVTNRGSDTVTVLLRRAFNAPIPGFDAAPGSPFAVGDEPIGIVAKDLNGDNQLDLAVGNYGTDNVSVLAGQGNGGFAPLSGSPFAAGDGASGVASADFNGDGAPDLAVTNYVADTVSVLLRTATGFASEPGSPYPTGRAPGQLATADFNADKKPDLAIPNSLGNTVTVLLNTTPDPPSPPGPGPGPGPTPGTPPPPAPSINARLVLTWTITKNNVRLNSATLHDLPAGGATVKIACKPCKVSQTLTAKKATLSLRKLVNKRLKRGTTFTVAVTKPGWSGLTFTRKVKAYGRTKKALRKAVRAPFVEGRRVTPPTG